MITVNNIEQYMESFCPQHLAFDRDNVGLIVGRSDKEVTKVLITLDVDERVAAEAVSIGADLIVSHHPLMFNAIRRLTTADPMQRTLMLLASKDIALFSAHTNLDCVCGGLNDYLAEKLGIRNTSVIEVVDETDGVLHGFGRIGELSKEITLAEMLQRCTDELNAKGLRYVGDLNRPVKRVAVNCGGGAGEMNICIALGADLFVTGDVKYNPARDAYDSGMAVIDAGHYETEHIVTDLLFDKLTAEFGDITFEKSRANIRILNYYIK